MVKSCPECGSCCPGQSFNSIPNWFCALKHLLTCSWHFQEHAAELPEGPTIDTSLWWTATKQEICSSCIPTLVRVRLSVWVKCRKDMGGSQKIIREIESHCVKKWKRTFQEAHGTALLTSFIWWDRIRSSVEKRRPEKSQSPRQMSLWPTVFVFDHSVSFPVKVQMSRSQCRHCNKPRAFKERHVLTRNNDTEVSPLPTQEASSLLAEYVGFVKDRL